MKNLLLLIILFMAAGSLAQDAPPTHYYNEILTLDLSDIYTTQWLRYHEQLSKVTPEKEEGMVDEYILLARPAPLGFIGDHYERLRIRFLSVIKDPENPALYLVYGKSKVKDNICPFQGWMMVDSAQVYDSPDPSGLLRGCVKGSYAFYEDGKMKGTGIFEGRFSSDFLINEQHAAEYDIQRLGEDGYANNQFEGRWTAYGSDKPKVCNWGDYRIPGSGQLDVGAGEFVPDESYLSRGWDSYYKAFLLPPDEPGVQEALQIEEEHWWE